MPLPRCAFRRATGAPGWTRVKSHSGSRPPILFAVMDLTSYRAVATEMHEFAQSLARFLETPSVCNTVQLSAGVVISRSTREAMVVNCSQLYPLSKSGTGVADAMR